MYTLVNFELPVEEAITLLVAQAQFVSPQTQPYCQKNNKQQKQLSAREGHVIH